MWRFYCFTVTLFFLVIFSFSSSAYAQATKYYNPPPSYSNASLTGKNFSGETIRSGEFSNANLELTNFSNADLRGSIFSASTMTKANLHGADISYGMADQVNFTNADLSDAIFLETIMLGSTFKNTNISGADFTDAILDAIQTKELCAIALGTNTKTGVATRDSLGCK